VVLLPTVRVAENTMVCLEQEEEEPGLWTPFNRSRMFLSSRKWPNSTILSASSRTKNFKLFKELRCVLPYTIRQASMILRLLFRDLGDKTMTSWCTCVLTSLMRLHSRPGVATTTDGCRLSSLSCFSIAIPPTTAHTCHGTQKGQKS
jgi:hypothetical protein